MAANPESIFWGRFFVAVPEAVLEDALLEYLEQRGLLDSELLRQIKKTRLALQKGRMKLEKLRGKNFLQRLLIVAPELINRNSVSLFERLGIIDKRDAGLLRLILRSSGLLKDGKPSSLEVLVQRLRRVFGIGFVEDSLRLAADMGMITRKEADFARGSIMLSRQTIEAIGALQRAKTWQDLLIVFGSGLADASTIRGLKLVGLLDSRTAEGLLEALKYSRSQWVIFEGGKRAEGLAARLAYTATGIMNNEFMDVLAAIQKMKKSELERIGLGWIHGKIKPEYFLLLRMASIMSTRYNRQLMEQMTDRRFRVRSGEPPIVSYARASKATDEELLRLLAQASRDARKRAEALAGAARGAEYTLRAAQLHLAMRQVWEGTGFLTIFGERETAQAAIEASFDLQKRYYDKFPDSVQTMLRLQAASGIDSFISRKENTLPLSRRVYGNINFWTNKVDKQVNIGLLQGQSAQEIAKRVEKLINPRVMGGVKYASMRLARTELANAFHLTTIRQTREQPWVIGYKWNKSSSHKGNDQCDQYAEGDHDGIGPGVFKKKNVPGKPHPQCMCYLTVVVMDDDAFVKAFNAGRFDQHFGTAVTDTSLAETAWLRLAKFGGRAAAGVALTQGASALGRMLDGKPSNVGFNPRKWKKSPPPTPAAALDDIVEAQEEEFGDLIEQASEVDYLSTDDIPAWALPTSTLSQSEKLAKATAVSQMVDEEEQRFIRRQLEFKSTANRFTDDILLEGLTADQVRLNLPSYFDQLEVERRYRTMFGEPEGGVLRVNTSGSPLEEWGKAMYGRSSYRTMNARLRNMPDVNDLEFYENEFGPMSTNFWEEVSEGVTDLVKDGDNTTMLDVFARQNRYATFDLDNIPASRKGKFGYRAEDLKSYYDEAIDSGAGLSIDDSTWQIPDRRTLSLMESHSDVIRSIDGSMRPVAESQMMYRISSKEWAGIRGPITVDDIGTVFEDKAYVSTEGLPQYFNDNGINSLDTNARGVRYLIHVPEGTMATRFNTFEAEVGLARGTKFQIMDVVDLPESSPFRQEVRVSVIGQQDTWTEAQEFLGEMASLAKKDLENILFDGDDDDMFDAIFGDN